jgi:hypothetical protein
VAALGALLIHGTWAFYANHLHGWTACLLAGAVQGASSFCMTFAVTLFIEYLLIFFNKTSPALRLIETTTIAIVGMFVMQIGVYWAAGHQKYYEPSHRS